MSVELIVVLSMCIAVARLILASKRDTNVCLISIEQGQAELKERTARLEGILKDLTLHRDNRTSTNYTIKNGLVIMWIQTLL